MLLVAVATLSIVGANAQSFGVKGGYNYATLNGDEAKDLNLKGLSGFYVGAFVELPIMESFAIQPELLYTAKGAKWERQGIISGQTYASSLNLNYLSVPVLAKLKFANVFSVMAGPQFGFLMNKPEVKWDTPLGSGSTELDKDAFGTFDVGLALGASVGLPSGLFVEARYTHGLTNVFDSDNSSLQDAQIGNSNDFKNAVISLGVGFKF